MYHITQQPSTVWTVRCYICGCSGRNYVERVSAEMWGTLHKCSSIPPPFPFKFKGVDGTMYEIRVVT